MADAEEKEKKLAAAKKRFEQLKKQKEKSKNLNIETKKDDQDKVKGETASAMTSEKIEAHEQEINTGEEEHATSPPEANEAPPREYSETTETPTKPAHNRQPSLSLQSKMRSSSFRRSSISQAPLSPSANGTKSPILPVLSPDGDSVTEIYRKQAARLDELERENKRLVKNLSEAERRWMTTEEELEELREANGEVAELKARAEKVDAQNEEIEKLKHENTSLQRQNFQLQSQSSRSRHASSPSQANVSPSDLHAQLESKSSTIESMEMEISNLRAQLDKQASSFTSHHEQTTALEEKLDRAEHAAGAAQRELADVKKSLDRASEKAVKEGSERTSTETKIRSLGREAEESKKSAEDSLKRVETLEKKLAALTTLHKESDARRQAGERERDRLDKDAAELRRRLAGLENENLRLKEEKERSRKKEASGIDDDGVDELENEERIRLENKIRGLESEVHDLRRGVWRDRRRELESESGPTSPGSEFDDVDLSSGPLPFRRQSMSRTGQGLTSLLNNGFTAITGGVSGGGHRRESSGFLMEDEDVGFDEDAFRRAQEEEAMRRVERVKEVKRGLKGWEGWRMDLVDCRVGGGGAGEIFDV